MKPAGPRTPRPVNACVDAVYVLSVRTFARRHAHIEQQLARHDIAFRYVFEHDAAAMDPALVERTFAPSDLRPPHQSLVLKHIQAWRDALAAGHRRVLVFEDDAVLADDFVARFDAAMAAADALPPGWLVFLGGVDTKVPASYFREPGPLVPLAIATTEACVHDAQAMRRRLAWLDTHRVTLAADHLMRHLDRELGIVQHWLRHPVVEQGSVLGFFDSELDANRRRHGPFFNRLRNRWNKFQRRRVREWLVRLQAPFSR